MATLEPVPQHLKEKVPSIIIRINPQQILDWAQPRMIKKGQDDYYSYPWRRLSRNLLYLYAHHRQQNQRGIDFVGASLLESMYKIQKPAGFQFGDGGKEERFEGSPEDKALWDYWLNGAHAVASHFHLKPALLRPTWVDRVALYLNHTGRITASESKRFKEVATFIDDWILRQEG